MTGTLSSRLERQRCYGEEGNRKEKRETGIQSEGKLYFYVGYFGESGRVSLKI